MNVFVETNFILEIALLQEQYKECEKIIALCKNREASLIIPAYSLVEPYETLIRRHKDRLRLKIKLDTELNQLARTESYTERINDIKKLLGLLIQSREEEMLRLQNTVEELLQTAQIIPLHSGILAASARYQMQHDLSPQDSIVYASILYYLENDPGEPGCFLNKNSKDFDDLDIVENLEKFNCRMLSRFDHGFQYIISKIK
ncbi:MAG: PIN domain-containing protein [Desulfococcaceae bacterium]|jgi:predicted nucleic acid-binding protein|nr:PIN domain-containing protein [Desulfococcaceae bacterium]